MPFDEEVSIDATITSASNILFNYVNQFNPGNNPVDKMYYLYDFGDYWQHEIEVLEVDHSDSNTPEIISGEGACPPEDCGGLPGFEDLKKCIKSGKPSKLFGEDRLPWLEGAGYMNFDPAIYDLERAKKSLKKWRDLE